MNAPVNDGGPAFPGAFTRLNNYNEVVDRSFQNGMTLRDYFAAKAMTSVMASPAWEHRTTPEQIAETSYAVADAMLAERAK